jgi:hypothetical protein
MKNLNKTFGIGILNAVWLNILMVLMFSSCGTFITKQWGLEDSDTIALNLTRDPNVGILFVTHVNGVSTDAVYKYGGETVYVNPLYIKLDGNPIIFTVLCPVQVGTDKYGRPIVQYKTTELRLTRLADIKAGDVLTLRWMYQTQTFAFIDATGNLVQQMIPAFY